MACSATSVNLIMYGGFLPVVYYLFVAIELTIYFYASAVSSLIEWDILSCLILPVMIDILFLLLGCIE
jgi:hypothetical protein